MFTVTIKLIQKLLWRVINRGKFDLNFYWYLIAEASTAQHRDLVPNKPRRMWYVLRMSITPSQLNYICYMLYAPHYSRNYCKKHQISWNVFCHLLVLCVTVPSIYYISNLLPYQIQQLLGIQALKILMSVMCQRVNVMFYPLRLFVYGLSIIRCIGIQY